MAGYRLTGYSTILDIVGVTGMNTQYMGFSLFYIKYSYVNIVLFLFNYPQPFFLFQLC